MVKKYLWVSCFLIAIFIYGICVGTYHIFPFQHIKEGKDLIDQLFIEDVITEQERSNSIHPTFLQRLLIKKVKIGDHIGSGGGISSSGSLLFLITNKGKVKAYDIEKYETLNIVTEDVPLNLAELINANILSDEDVELRWFRVNGVYSEQINSVKYRLYVSHNGFDSIENCITHNISSIDYELDKLSLNQITKWHTLFTADPCINPNPEYYLSSHPFEGSVSGGNIVEFNENQLLVTIGDYMRHGLNNTEAYSMNPSNPYGKTILLDKESGKWSVFTMGHRNAAGLFIDNEGTIWLTENGPRHGDELNIIEHGDNYGWPLVSLGVWYNPSYRLQGGKDYGNHSDFKKPIFSWTPAIAPANLVRIEGTKFRYWSGDLIVGTRKNQSLRRLRLDESHRVIYDEKIELGHRVRDLTTLPDDTLVLFTDDGYLIFIDDGGSSFLEMGRIERERFQKLDKYDRFKTS